MHELSLVGSLLDQVQAICQERHVQRLNSVKIAVGELSGVEPPLLLSAFQELLPRYFSNSVQLHIEQVPLIAKCPLCAIEFTVRDFRFVCPQCGKDQVELLKGEELKLLSLDGEVGSPGTTAQASQG